jgi:hypothetical protein
VPYDVIAGTYSSVTFATSGFTANITNIRWSGITRTAIDTSHMGVPQPAPGDFGNRFYIPSGFSDPGELVLDVHFSPDSTYPLHTEPEIVTVIWPKAATDAVAPTWSGLCFCRQLEINDPMDEKMTGTMTLKFSGPITRTFSA